MPYLTPVETEVTIEKLDKVARTLSEKVKTFARLFGILIGWLIFNIVIALFVDRTRSLSLNMCRMISEGLRSILTQDTLFVLTIFFDNKINCVITLAMMFSFGVVFFLCVLNVCNDGVLEKSVNKRFKSRHARLQDEAYVVSYKQQVAFLA